MILALSQTAACQVTPDSNCPDGNKKVAEVVGQRGNEVEELEEEEAKQTEGGGKMPSLVQQIKCPISYLSNQLKTAW